MRRKRCSTVNRGWTSSTKHRDRVQLGNGAPAVVLELTENEVRVDANHPLAGMALTFEIELVAVQ